MSEAARYRLIVDGYNVVAPIAPPRGRQIGWLAHERDQLLRRIAEGLPAEICQRTCVVFDAKDAPPDLPSQFVRHRVTVRFAREVAEADDLIETLIRQNSSPKRLTIVSSDRRLQTAAKRRGCVSLDSETFLDALMGGTAKRILAGGMTADGPPRDDVRTRQPDGGSPDDPAPELGSEELRQMMEEPGQSDSIDADPDSLTTDQWLKEFGL